MFGSAQVVAVLGQFKPVNLEDGRFGSSVTGYITVFCPLEQLTDAVEKHFRVEGCTQCFRLASNGDWVLIPTPEKWRP